MVKNYIVILLILVSLPFTSISQGSCSSPDGPSGEIDSPPEDFQELKDNGYCIEDDWGNFLTTCWTLTPNTDSIQISIGWKQVGCDFVDFDPGELFDSNCNKVGEGTEFSVTPGEDYTWCIDMSAWSLFGSCKGFTDVCPWYVEEGSYPLPVEFKRFEIDSSGSTDILTWEVYSEVNNRRFIIVRENSKIDTFYKRSRGDTQFITKYTLRVENTKFGITYYHLFQQDHNGKKEFLDSGYIVRESSNKELIKIIDLRGREVSKNYRGTKIYIYSDGSKVIR